MAEFQELIKNFDRIRDYMRQFYIYGFKARTEFDGKSARTYDNERRRIESWLADYTRADYTARGKHVYINVDSKEIPQNPLYTAWKSKSFTDNDLMLHFFLLDQMAEEEKAADGQAPRGLTAGELCDRISADYGVAFDSQTVRLKLKEYEGLGLLCADKDKKQLRYRLTPPLAPEICGAGGEAGNADSDAAGRHADSGTAGWHADSGTAGGHADSGTADGHADSTAAAGQAGSGTADGHADSAAAAGHAGSGTADGHAVSAAAVGPAPVSPTWRRVITAVKFFQGAAPFGFIGSTILDREEADNELFQFKHHFIVHTLEDGVLADVLTAMRQGRAIAYTNRSGRTGNVSHGRGLPLKIFVSTRTGRRYVCLYHKDTRRFANIRLDSMSNVEILEFCDDYARKQDLLKRNLDRLWGVSFSGNGRLEEICIKLYINEEKEAYVLDRLYREGRGGEVQKIRDNEFLYTGSFFDTNEMLSWVKTFTGRILDIQGSNHFAVAKITYDWEKMYEMYCRDGNENVEDV